MDLTAQITEPTLYEKTFDALIKTVRKNKQYLPAQAGIDSKTLYTQKNELIKAFIKTLKQGKYCTLDNPYLAREIEHKSYISIEYSLTDILLQEAVTKITHIALQNHKLICINSKPSVEQKLAFIKHTANYIKLHPGSEKYPLYIARINLLTAQNPPLLTEQSLIWQTIKQVFANQPKLLETIFNYVYRPFILNKTNSLYSDISSNQRPHCITDIFIHCDLYNLDNQFANNDTIFYGRTSKFILIMSHKKNIFDQTIDQIKNFLATQDRFVILKNIYSTVLTETPKTNAFNCLGMVLFYNGSIGLKFFQLNALLTTLKQRLLATAQLLHDYKEKERGRLLADFCNQFISKQISTSQAESIHLLRAITHQEQLEYIDTQIALMIATIISKHEGTKSFNIIPGWKIRKMWKLKSISEIL